MTANYCEAEPAGAVALGRDANLGSTLRETELSGQQRRRLKYRLRDKNQQAQSLLKTPVTENQSKCGRCRRDVGGAVSFRKPVNAKTGEIGGAFVNGVVTCGSRCSCAVCADRIMAGRRQQLQQAVTAAEELGMSMYMMTVTMRHHRGQRLEPLLEALSAGIRAVRHGGSWIRFRDRLDWVGDVYTLEATHGENGWHPHRHYLVFFKRDLTDLEESELQDFVYTRFRDEVVKLGMGVPIKDKCVDITKADTGASTYVSKLKFELISMEKGGRKGNRSAFQILDEWKPTDGRNENWRLWIEHCQAMKGKHFIHWSRGFKELLGVADKTDEDILEESADAYLTDDEVVLPAQVFDGLIKKDRTLIPDLLTLHDQEGAAAVYEAVEYLCEVYGIVNPIRGGPG